MVSFVRNGLCTKWSLYEIECKILGTASYKKSLFEVTPMLLFLYEMVTLVRSRLCSKWSLYEVTVNHSPLYRSVYIVHIHNIIVYLFHGETSCFPLRALI